MSATDDCKTCTKVSSVKWKVVPWYQNGQWIDILCPYIQTAVKCRRKFPFEGYPDKPGTSGAPKICPPTLQKGFLLADQPPDKSRPIHKTAPGNVFERHFPSNEWSVKQPCGPPTLPPGFPGHELYATEEPEMMTKPLKRYPTYPVMEKWCICKVPDDVCTRKYQFDGYPGYPPILRPGYVFCECPPTEKPAKKPEELTRPLPAHEPEQPAHPLKRTPMLNAIIPPATRTFPEPCVEGRNMYHAANPRVVFSGNPYEIGKRFDRLPNQTTAPLPPFCYPVGAHRTAIQGNAVLGTQQKANWYSQRCSGSVNHC